MPPPFFQETKEAEDWNALYHFRDHLLAEMGLVGSLNALRIQPGTRITGLLGNITFFRWCLLTNAAGVPANTCFVWTELQWSWQTLPCNEHVVKSIQICQDLPTSKWRAMTCCQRCLGPPLERQKHPQGGNPMTSVALSGTGRRNALGSSRWSRASGSWWTHQASCQDMPRSFARKLGDHHGSSLNHHPTGPLGVNRMKPAMTYAHIISHRKLNLRVTGDLPSGKHSHQAGARKQSVEANWSMRSKCLELRGSWNSSLFLCKKVCYCATTYNSSPQIAKHHWSKDSCTVLPATLWVN